MKSNTTRSLDAFGMEPPPARQTPEELELAAMIDEVSAVIAADHAAPIQPRPSTLTAIQRRIRAKSVQRPVTNWITWSGWAAAAAIMLFALLKPQPQGRNDVARAATPDVSAVEHPANPITQASDHTAAEEQAPPEQAPASVSAKAVARSMAPAEPLSLREEVDTLRAQVSSLLKRDAERVTAVDNLAWPVVIRMKKPGSTELSGDSVLRSLLSPQQLAMNQLSISKNLSLNNSIDSAEAISPPVASAENVVLPDTALPTPGARLPEADGGSENLGSVIVGGSASGLPNGTPPEPLTAEDGLSSEESFDTSPTAIPVYDPARDQGQLLLSNLENPPQGQAYYLWAKVTDGSRPQLVGALPENINASSDAFEFKLGAAGVIPQSFIITQGKLNQPQAPTSSNTILQGP